MARDTSALLADRARLLGAHISTFYENPVHFVRGDGVWLWDAEGRRYLDCYNNVPHVGHCNTRVVEAISHQASTLNTHTRYLHEGILDYVERLTATMDESLNAAILTCTGSEANDIALRMAEAITGHRGIISTDATYHGNTTLVSHLSQSNIPNVGFGLDRYFQFADAPDSYRNPDPDGTAFVQSIEAQIKLHQQSDIGFAALVICPYFLNEGFPDNPDGWLRPVADLVRKAGGLLICDEVQSGFGRTGSHMWAYEKMGIIPDIVTLGKPMANGHPVGGVIAHFDKINKFREGYRYFNTFGGNPVSVAAAMAVLDELEQENLVANAAMVGAYAKQGLKNLQDKYEMIGDVRGSGLIFGAEFVEDRETKAPARALAIRVMNDMRERGVILSTLGRHKNTLKIRPPMPFSKENADMLLSTLDDVLSTLSL